MTELTLPKQVTLIQVTNTSLSNGCLGRLQEYKVEVQSKFDEEEYESWISALVDCNHFILDGMRLVLYGVAQGVSAQPKNLTFTLTFYTAGEEKLGAWVSLVNKWIEQYGDRYRGPRPAKKKPDATTGDG